MQASIGENLSEWDLACEAGSIENPQRDFQTVERAAWPA
jgi:hypothetical protein